MDQLKKLINGYKDFHSEYIGEEHFVHRQDLAKRQRPKVMMIACSDSRANPVILTKAGLGEIFMVNNVANLVPPYQEGENSHHSTSAAIEFAVNNLEVDHIVILGHSNCGGIRALMEGNVRKDRSTYSFIGPWMNIAKEAKEIVEQKNQDLPIEEKSHACELSSLLVSLENLKNFPWVKQSMSENKLQVHAWHFDIGSGVLNAYNPEKQEFEDLLGANFSD